MTWDEICALDSEALNIALEALAGRVWHQTTLPTTEQRLWRWETTWSTVAHLHTSDDWGRCMGLAWHYGIDVRVPSVGCQGQVRFMRGFFSRYVDAPTEAEARLAVCRLALWSAQQA